MEKIYLSYYLLKKKFSRRQVLIDFSPYFHPYNDVWSVFFFLRYLLTYGYLI